VGSPGRIAKWRTLSAGDKRSLLVAALLLPAFWVGLRVLGLRRWHQFLHRPVADAQDDMKGWSRAKSIGSLVNVAARHSVFPVTCLTKSLVLEWLLRRQGLPAVLRIGVRRQADVLEAHAWVEFGGMPVNDAPDVACNFLPFQDRVPTSAFEHP
jgi:hypothetical protein